MKHSIYWSEDLGALRVQIVGESTAQDILALGEEMQAILSTKAHALMVFDNSESKVTLSREARKALVVVASNIDHERIAAYGASNFNRVIARIAMSLAGHADKIQFFATEAEALEWILETDVA